MDRSNSPSRTADRFGQPPAYSDDFSDLSSAVTGNGSSLRLLPYTDSTQIPLVSPISFTSDSISAFVSASQRHEYSLNQSFGRNHVNDWNPSRNNYKANRHSVEELLDEAVAELNSAPLSSNSKPQKRLRFAIESTPPCVARKPVENDKAENLPQAPHSVSPIQRTYHPSVSSINISSKPSSVFQDAPVLPPVNHGINPFAPAQNSSPTRLSGGRPWSPSRGSSELSRPAASNVSFEPEHINGSPRPGTPSSRYGSPKRPLPPAPLFAAQRPISSDSNYQAPDATSIQMPEDDDVFAVGRENEQEYEDGDRPESYVSQSTYKDEESDDEYDQKVEHYGPAPDGVQKRRGVRPVQTATREVALTHGELILECKIPTILLSFLPRRDTDEFTNMRYTAVTCDPNEFVEKGYKLRQNFTKRDTELFICITMYNEDEVHFTRTMHGVMRNIAHFCSRTKSRTWGKDGWEKIVVCIISDGRTKVHPRTLDALAAMGVYQDGIAKNQVNQKDVTAHVYEYTTQVSLDADLKFKGAEKGIVPCQMIFCLKEQNTKKLNSHRWFFNAFGKALNPNICILLDVGTKPDNTALYHLWKAFDNDSSVAGAAGEIFAAKGKGWLGLLNPLVASQNFEYKMSNILDKPLESVFGYITVLPGALSAYRYHALQNDHTGHGPLSQYFKGETLHGQNADVFTANMYLAEDRILCWELVAKRSEQWVLKFVSQAKGETDVPDSVPEFISQRRRWLNGAFFAAIYSLVHFRQIWSTDHTIGRKIALHVEFVYQFVNLMFTFFSLANFYLTFYFIAGGLTDPKLDPFGHNIAKYIFLILRYSCVLLICVQFILSMGNRPQGAKRMYLSSMVIYGVIMVYTTFAALYIVVKSLKDPSTKFEIGNNIFTNMIISTGSTIGLYFLMSFIYLDPWHMFTSAAQYFALLPSYICTLQVYAFCNAHDVTWGTKGDNIRKTDLGAAKAKGSSNLVELEMPSEQLDIDSCYDEALRNLRDRVEVPQPPPSETQAQEDYYRAVRTYMVIVWLVCNAILAMAVSEAYDTQNVADNFYLKFILWSVAIVALFRAIGSSTFAMLGVIHSIAEGKLKWSSKWSERGSTIGSKVSSGSKVRLSHGSWFSSVGGWFSGIGSKVKNIGR